MLEYQRLKGLCRGCFDSILFSLPVYSPRKLTVVKKLLQNGNTVTASGQKIKLVAKIRHTVWLKSFILKTTANYPNHHQLLPDKKKISNNNNNALVSLCVFALWKSMRIQSQNLQVQKKWFRVFSVLPKALPFFLEDRANKKLWIEPPGSIFA